ncbi:uncharacterized protein LOC133181612 [Saccostrea echinata]|uniref:uncharacterized protein LOC133181612 n=1 Tax=Saccostrea echinata TaxID=191078 RepID=UPI002A8402D9|nr:uncharacterized protein LOC133181612 [Saccostrea echinata]
MLSFVTSVLLVAVLVDGAPTSTMVTATTASAFASTLPTNLSSKTEHEQQAKPTDPQELNPEIEVNKVKTFNQSKDTLDSHLLNVSVTAESPDNEFNNTADDAPREQPKMMMNNSIRLKKTNAIRLKQIQSFLQKIRKLRSMIKERISSNSTENINDTRDDTIQVIPGKVLQNILSKFKQYKEQVSPPTKVNNTSEFSSVNANYSVNIGSDKNTSLLLNFVRLFESESPIIRTRISQNTNEENEELLSEDDIEDLIEERDENREEKDDDYDISDFIIRVLGGKQELNNVDWMYTPENQAEPHHEADNTEWIFTPDRTMESLQEPENTEWNFAPKSHVEPLHESKTIDWKSEPENRIEPHHELFNLKWNFIPKSQVESVAQDKRINENEEPHALVTDHDYHYHTPSHATENKEASSVDTAGNVEDGKLESLLWKDFFSFQIPDKITKRKEVPSLEPERKISNQHYNEKHTEIDGKYDYEEDDSLENEEDYDYQSKDNPDYTDGNEEKPAKAKMFDEKSYDRGTSNDKATYGKSVSVKDIEYHEEGDSFESGEDIDYQYEDIPDYVDEYEDRSSKIKVPNKKTYSRNPVNKKGSFKVPFYVKDFGHDEEGDSFESGEDIDYQYEDIPDYVDEYEDRSSKVKVPNKKTYSRNPVNKKGSFKVPFYVKDFGHDEEGDSFESGEDIDYQYEDTPDYVDEYDDRSSKYKLVNKKLYSKDSSNKTPSTVASYKGKHVDSDGESREGDDYVDESKENLSAGGIWKNKRFVAKDAVAFANKLREAYRKSTKGSDFFHQLNDDNSGSEKYDDYSSEEILSPHYKHRKDINYDKSASEEYDDYSSEETLSPHHKHNKGITRTTSYSESRIRSSSTSNERDGESGSKEIGSEEIGHSMAHMWEDDSSESYSQEYYSSAEDYHKSSEEHLPIAAQAHPPKNNVNHYRNFFDKHAWESEHHNRYQEESRIYHKYNDDDNTIEYIPPTLQVNHLQINRINYEPTTPVPVIPPQPIMYRTYAVPSTTPPPPPTNPPQPIIHRTYLAPSPPPPPTFPPQPIIHSPTPPPPPPPSPPIIHRTYIPPTPTTPPPPPPSPPRTIVHKTYIPPSPTPPPPPSPSRTIIHRTYIPPSPTTPPPPPIPKLQILRTPIFPPTFPPPTNPPLTLPPPTLPPPKTEPIPKLQILRTPIAPPPKPEPTPRLQIWRIPINLPPVPKPEPTPRVYIPNKPIPAPAPKQKQQHFYFMFKPKKTKSKKVSSYDVLENEIMNVDLQKAWTNSYKQNLNKGYYKRNPYSKRQNYGYGKNSYGYGYRGLKTIYDKKPGYGYGLNTRNSYDKKTGYGHSYRTTPHLPYKRNRGYGYKNTYGNRYSSRPLYGKRFSSNLSIRPFITPYPMQPNIIQQQVNKHVMGLKPLLPLHFQPVIFGSSVLHQSQLFQNSLQKINQYSKRRTSKY